MKPRPWSLSSSSVLARWGGATEELEKARAESGRGLTRDKARWVGRREMARRLAIFVDLCWG
jgi:hypothetical protein